MKRFLTILLISFFIINLVSSQSNETNSTIPKINPEDPTPKLDSLIEKEISLDENYAKPIKFIFGIKENEVKISDAIILVTLWIVFFIGIKKIINVSEIEFFKYKETISTVIITLIISISGGLLMSNKIIKEVENILKFLDNWEFAGFLVEMLALVILIIIFTSSMKKLKKQSEEEKRTKDIEILKNQK